VTLEEARPLIDAGLVYTGGTHLFEDVAADIAAGRMQFWSSARSICITEILQSPRKKVFNVWLAAGDLGELRQMYPAVELWARQQGCTIATFTGRPGWTRTFLSAEEGWTQTLAVMTKDLPDVEALR